MRNFMKERKENNNREHVIMRQVFLSAYPMLVMSGLVSGINGFVDSIFVSKYIGINGVASMGIISPLNVLLWAVINLLCNGTQVIAGRKLGSGDRWGVHASTALCRLILIFVSILLAVICILFAGPMAKGLGASEEIVPFVVDYLKGLSLGIPGMIMCGYFTTFLIFHCHTKATTTGTTLMTITNVVFDYLFIRICGMGMMGAALATTISYYVTLCFLLSYSLKHKIFVHIDWNKLDWKMFPDMIKAGMPSAMTDICLFLRPMFMNHLLMRFCGVNAVAALAAEGIVATFLGVFSATPGNVVLMRGSVLVGERDSVGLRSLVKAASKYGGILQGIIGGIAFVFADYFVKLFCSGNPEVERMAAIAVRMLIIGLFINLFVVILKQTYYALGENSLVSILNVMNFLAIPVLIMSFLVPKIGANGAWYSLAITELLTLLLIVVLVLKKVGIKEFSGSQLIMYGNDLDVPEENKCDWSIHTIDEIIEICREIGQFNNQKGLNERSNYHVQLAIEEITTNIVQHGFQSGKKHAIDIRAIYAKDQITLRIRDNGRPFNPTEQLELMNPKDPTENLGRRIVARIAREMNYQMLFGLNVMMIVLDVEEDETTYSYL